ncbi:MAG: hypothetical protein MI922_27645, partial [Bacteroidales bacterium]|nr:hypothetical protein [Bacteroidales bacterium]
MNVDCKLNDYIKLRADGFVMFDMVHSPQGNFWSNTTNRRPDRYPLLIPIDSIQSMTSNGETFDTDELRKSALIIDGEYVMGGTSQYQSNIYGDLRYKGYSDFMGRTLQLNSGIDIDLEKIIKGLDFNFFYSFDNYAQFRTNNSINYAIYEPTWHTAQDGTDSLVVTKHGDDDKSGSISLNNVNFIRLHGFYGVLSFSRSFSNVHRIDATAMGFGSKYTYQNKIHPSKSLTYGIRLNYSYDNRYLAEVNMVTIGSPLIAPDNRWATSPSLGLGWILSQEKFMENIAIVDYLKLRGTWGIINTDNGFDDDYYSYENTYVTKGTFTYKDGTNKNKSVVSNYVANPNLSYEKRKEFNLGFESLLLNNSLWIEAAYFNSVYSDQYTNPMMKYPAYVGAYPRINYNETKTSGYEVGVNYTQKVSDVQLSVGANLMYSKPVNVQLDEVNYLYDYRQREGKESDGIYGYVFDRFYTGDDFDANSELNSDLAKPEGNVAPGDLKYVDINNDGVINDDDQKLIGNSSPRYSYGLNFSVKYKAWELFALGTGIMNSKSMLRTNNEPHTNYYHAQGEVRYSENAFNRWTPETGESATHPRLTTMTNTNNSKTSTFWMYNEDYFKLQTVQLTYLVSAAKIGWMKELRLYVRGSNLLTISESKDILDLRIGMEPISRYYAVGLNIIL